MKFKQKLHMQGMTVEENTTAVHHVSKFQGLTIKMAQLCESVSDRTVHGFLYLAFCDVFNTGER